MKISSGWSKGLKILTPAGFETRPTRERVRQSAINMLEPWISGARILDLFAGSGAVGIELVSRGASGAVFVETARDALDCLRVNVSQAGARAAKQGLTLTPWRVEAQDAHLLINETASLSYDLIWADPPYEMVEKFMRDGSHSLANILSPSGVMALESHVDAGTMLAGWAETSGFTLKKQRRYGVTLISIWQKN